MSGVTFIGAENEEEVKKAGLILRALSNPLRKRILQLLHEKQTPMVTEIFQQLGIEQSTASLQLKILRNANIVNRERNGKAIHYRVNYSYLTKLEKLVSEFISNNHSILAFLLSPVGLYSSCQVM
jgi:DNA-binding transcriptional ArsR family regulator